MGYLRNRLLQAFVTLYSIVTIGFVFIRLMPGGPRDYLRSQVRSNPQRFGLGSNPTPQEIRTVVERILITPPDQPIWESYVDYMLGALQGDLGISYIVEPGVPVMKLIAEAAPWTIFLSSISMTYGLFVGIILGTVMAYYEGTKFDMGMTASMLFNSAIPYYVIAIVLLYVFAYQFQWFPRGGRMDPTTTPGFNWPFVRGVFYHAALPSMSMILSGFGAGALGMRANAIRILGSDYIQVARLRGLSAYKISTRYLGRNAILPMYTGIVIGIGGILGGSVILESIFSYPGMGLLMFEATVARDFPLLTANIIIATLFFVTGTLIADFTYALIDPRAEQSSMG
jgi:peptide/nickel transport system permease protein